MNKSAVDPNLFNLDPQVTFLNHGSFGACPKAVLDYQNELRHRLERQPVQFFQRDLEPLLDRAREALGAFVGADPEDLVFVPNATSGVNAVLRSIPIEPGAELLVSDHEYNACRNAIQFAAGQRGARVVEVQIPFPIRSRDEVVEAVLSRVTSRTRLLLLDHVTSPTALVFPVQTIISELRGRGIDTFVDGAHAPGMIPLEINKLGAAFYTGNCHKWICAPKGAGFLYVEKSKQQHVRPLVISHGANSPRTDRSRFQIEFGWMGTGDPTAALSVPMAIDYMDRLVPGGWPAVMERNRRLALAARKMFCNSYNLPLPAPGNMIGSMASMPLPDSIGPQPKPNPTQTTPWQDLLLARCKIEVPIVPWPAYPKRLVRVSAQLYNHQAQYDLLAEGIRELLDDQL